MSKIAALLAGVALVLTVACDSNGLPVVLDEPTEMPTSTPEVIAIVVGVHRTGTPEYTPMAGPMFTPMPMPLPTQIQIRPTATEYLEPTATTLPTQTAMPDRTPVREVTARPLQSATLIPTSTPTLASRQQLACGDEVIPGVVQIVSGGRMGSGFFVNQRGDVVSSANVVGDYSTVDVHLCDSEVLVGEVVGLDKKLDLAMITIPNPSRAEFSPLILGTSDRVWGWHDYTVVGVTADGSLISPVVGEVRSSVLALDGAKWFEMPEETIADLPRSYYGGPVVDDHGNVVGIVVGEGSPKWRNAGSTYFLAVEGIKERLGFSTPATPTEPPPQGQEVEGEWTYFSEACSDEYGNCEPFQDEYLVEVAELEATGYAPNSKTAHILPKLRMQCWDNGLFEFTFLPAGPVGDDFTIGAWTLGAELGSERYTGWTGWDRSGTSDYERYYASVITEKAIRFVKLFLEAESSGELVQLGASSELGLVAGIFDPMGFATHYWRLPCTN